jgi:hypothetical protein
MIVAIALLVNARLHPGSELQKMIDTAISSAVSSVKVDQPVYDFEAAESLQIYRASSLSITAATAGTTLNFFCGAGVHIANSSKIHFTGFTINYRNACFAQGRVIRAPSNLVQSTKGATPMQSVDIKFDTTNFPSPDDAIALAGIDRPPISLLITYVLSP